MLLRLLLLLLLLLSATNTLKQQSLLSQKSVNDTEKCNWNDLFNTGMHGIEMIAPSPPSVIFDPKAIHPYSHFSQSSMFKFKKELVSKKHDKFERSSVCYEQDKDSIQSSPGSENCTDPHLLEEVPVTTEDISQIDFKLDFTHFEAP
jgi:hypothetical protein